MSKKCEFEIYLFSKGTQLLVQSIKSSGALTADSAGELHVLGHDGDTLGMDGAEVGVLEEADHVSLRGLLEGKDGRGLETELVSVLRSDLTDESLEGEFSNEKLGALLESSDFSESDGSWSESVWLLDSTGGWVLFGSLVGDVLSWVLGSGALAGSLLGAGHFSSLIEIIKLHPLAFHL